MKKTVLVLGFIWIGLITAFSQVNVYPTNWWTDMKMNKIQIMLHSTDGTQINNISINYPGVTVAKIHPQENKNYSFVDVIITPVAKPGIMKVLINNKSSVNFPIKARKGGNGKTYARGISSADFIYLLMPDRFSNGEESNDQVIGMMDQSLNRDSIYDRHGGDLQGVINHIDYLKSLGVTALWMTPVLENDMPNRTEHGYAITNHYKVDPRLGGNKTYLALSEALRKNGLKLIQDAVYNHVGDHHFTVLDPPMKNWLNHWPSFTKTSYREQVLFDPYADSLEKKILSDGWFTNQMPDLNQKNPFVANFLIQHAIWCVEEFGVDAWRIDTYVYNDLDFMNRCNKALLTEFPSITMFGETWVHGVLNQAYFTRNKLNVPYKSNLHGVTDFQTLFYGILPALNEKFGWTEGVSKLYNTLANDFIYENPMNNVIFLDNHDLSRFYSQVNENSKKQKIGIGWLLTSRGIPQMYYGTEILMKGKTNPDGWVRLDFPGGWKGDEKNAFSQQNLDAQELETLNYVKKLGHFRKSSSALKNGKLTQYIPENGLYVYFRHDASQTIAVIINTSENSQVVNLSNYGNWIKGLKYGTDVILETTFLVAEPIEVNAMDILILEIQK